MLDTKIDLNQIINEGKKIEVDEKAQVIKIIKGVCIKNSEYEPLFDEIKVSTGEIDD